MPHQCVRCSRVYEQGSNAVLKGCECGGRFFFFVKKPDQTVQNFTQHLTPVQKEQIETAVTQQIVKQEEETHEEPLTTEERDEIEKEALDLADVPALERPVILDLESIRVKKPGKFELNLASLFKKKPLVYRLEEGKYVVDVASLFAQDEDSDDGRKKGS